MRFDSAMTASALHVFTGAPDGVITYLSSFIGAATGDTGWVDPFEISACSGTELRIVSWGALQLTFGDVSKVLQGRRHFFSFAYGQYSFDGVDAVRSMRRRQAC